MIWLPRACASRRTSGNSIALVCRPAYVYRLMSRRLIQRVAVLSVALSLAVGVLPRLALCVGPDGHRAIELINAACCDRTTPSAGPDVQAAPLGCAPECVDTPLTVSLVLPRDRSDCAAPPSVAAAVLSSVRAHRVAGHLSYPVHSVPFQIPPRILRTTIRIC